MRRYLFVSLLLLAGCASQPSSQGSGGTKSTTGNGQPIMRYMDALNGACTKLSINDEDKITGCKGKGVIHMGFTNGRADVIVGLGDHLVAFSGAQESGIGTAHYVLYVNRLYYDADPVPASGKCEMVGDPAGRSTLVCDAAALTPDKPYHPHLEFDVTSVEPVELPAQH